MKAQTLKQFMLYSYRYVVGYTVIAIFALYFLTWRLGSVPPGLSTVELMAASSNTSLSSIASSPLNPLHSLLQWVSMNMLGANAISIRLPSVVIALLTTLLLYKLLRKWFGRPTALASVALVLSADWFLFIARLGTGAISFSLWFTLMMYALIKLIEKRYSWLIVYTFAASALLFIPFGIYAVATTTIAVFVCKMFRTRIVEATSQTKIISSVIAFIAVSLFAVASWQDIEFLKAILGLQTLPTPLEYAKNFIINTSGVVMIWPDNNPLLGPSGIFLIRFFEFIFMLFGVIMLWVTRVNRLGLIVIVNAIVLSLVGGLSNGSRGGALLIIPGAIFMTAGLRHFIHRWQRTFPKNPYARTALYIPLAILIVGTTVLHYQSYFSLWPRQAATTRTFSYDLKLLNTELNSLEGSCVVYGATKEVQTLLREFTPNCNTSFDGVATENNNVITSAKSNQAAHQSRPTKVLVSAQTENNVRWLVSTPE